MPCRKPVGGPAVARVVATIGGLGRAPVAPGTIGSLVGLAVAWSLLRAPLVLQASVMTLLTVVGFWAAVTMYHALEMKDPPVVIVDEAVGMVIATFALPPDLLGFPVVAFLLFRLLDVWKPAPIRWLEALPGGIGIMADDIGAGLLTNGLCQLWVWLGKGWPWS
ncbi:MAG: phosphatidylglycerophosphatase A [Candidatus Methylomirabilales bacterium]